MKPPVVFLYINTYQIWHLSDAISFKQHATTVYADIAYT